MARCISTACWVALLTGGVSLGRDGPPLPDPADLRFTAEVVGDAPLPRQAVRLRLTVTNPGKRVIEGLHSLEVYVAVTGVKVPDGREVEPWMIRRLTLHEESNPVSRGGPQWNDYDLGPGESRSVSFPVAVHWGEPGALDPAAPAPPSPLFPGPGEYTLVCVYGYGYHAKPGDQGQEALILSAAAKVVVGKPDPTRDGPWASALADDPALTRALILPTERCSDAQLVKLRGLLEKAPGSSYANYARLKLAQHYFGFGDRKVSARVNMAMAADAVDEIHRQPGFGRFPFLPHAEILHAKATNVCKEKLKTAMSPGFRDALEWIDVVGPLLSEKEWQEFRVPLPPPKEPDRM